MRIAYFDCFAGISGDMTLGALVDAGLDFEILKADLAKLHLHDYELRQEKVVKQGMAGTKIHVLAQEGHIHRHLQDIVQIIEESELVDEVKEKAIAVFRRLAEAEAKVHGTTLEQVHFHEVGAVDAIIDIVGAVIGLWRLGIKKVYASAVHTGKGFTQAAHGTIPIPAPATLELLRGIPVYTQDISFELVTPTGAALLSTYCQDFGNMPVMEVESIGYGAGNRDLAIPNLLRIMLGEKSELDVHDYEFKLEHGMDGLGHTHHTHHEHSAHPGNHIHPKRNGSLIPAKHQNPSEMKAFNEVEMQETSTLPPMGEARFLEEQSIQLGQALMLEANIDDMNPEFYDYFIQKFLKEGAMDVFLQPIQMKKNRPAITLSVQIHPTLLEKFTTLILKETTSIGVRVYPVTKYMLPYEVTTVDTLWGKAKVKIVRAGEQYQTVSPEYEDCRRIAEAENLPLKEVYEEIKRAVTRVEL